AGGVAQLASALKTVAESIGTLKFANGDAIAKQLAGVADALQEAPETQTKSRAARLAEAAKELEYANKQYEWAFEQAEIAQQKAEKAKAAPEERADAVVKARREIEEMQQGGKPNTSQRSILEQVLDADADLLSPGDVQIAEVEQVFARSGDLGERGRTAVDDAKRRVLGQLQRGAGGFAGQLKQRLQAAKLKAEQERAEIQQACRKRKRRIFCANIARWGPTVLSWLRRDGARQLGDVYALQGARLAHRERDSTVRKLQKAGFSAVFAAARASDRGQTGACGGAGVLVKGCLKATSHRHSAHAWFLIIFIYLGPSHPAASGENPGKLTALAAFLSVVRAPWVLCGGFNRPCEDMVKSGWTTALGPTAYVGLDTDQRTCFLGDAPPSNIDYALVSDGGQRLVRGIQLVRDVPWPPHIGLDIAIRADVGSNRSRTMDETGGAPLGSVVDGLSEFALRRDAQLPQRRNCDARNVDYLQGAAEDRRAEVSSMESTTVGPNSELNDVMDCAGARKALQQMPPLDRLSARSLEIDAINVDDAWEVADEMHHGPTSTAPPYIQNCAAYHVDPDSADQLGATCRRLTSTLETYYYTAYHIPLEDRHHFLGRGQACEFKTQQTRESDHHQRCASDRSDWWGRAENIFSTLVKL
ncbi:unnamed protein product, partial [Prorocentrum cordatum]